MFARSVFVLVAVAAGLVCGCDDSVSDGDSSLNATGGTDGGSNADPSGIAALALQAGRLDEGPAAGEVAVACADCPSESTLEGYMLCDHRRVSVTKHPSMLVGLMVDPPDLWPGSVVHGRDAVRGQLVAVQPDGGDVSFSISLQGSAQSSVSATVPSASKAAYREALNGLLAQGLVAGTAGASTIHVEQVYSKEQTASALGVSAGWSGLASVEAQVGLSYSDEQSEVLIDFTQSYFRVDIDPPSSPADLFASHVTGNDLTQAGVGPGNPPLYVSSIVYGRRIVGAMTTSDASSALALSGKLETQLPLYGNPEVSVDHTVEERLRQQAFSATVLGGGVASDFDQLVGLIEEGATYQPATVAVPIGYVLSYVSDNSPADFALTDEFTVLDCQPVPLQVELANVTVSMSGAWDVYPDDPDPYIKGALSAFPGDEFDTTPESGTTFTGWTSVKSWTLNVAPGEEGVSTVLTLGAYDEDVSDDDGWYCETVIEWPCGAGDGRTPTHATSPASLCEPGSHWVSCDKAGDPGGTLDALIELTPMLPD